MGSTGKGRQTYYCFQLSRTEMVYCGQWCLCQSLYCGRGGAAGLSIIEQEGEESNAPLPPASQAAARLVQADEYLQHPASHFPVISSRGLCTRVNRLACYGPRTNNRIDHIKSQARSLSWPSPLFKQVASDAVNQMSLYFKTRSTHIRIIFIASGKAYG